MAEYELPGAYPPGFKALARAYAEQIGYDPFEDDPTIDPEIVRETLAEHGRIDAFAAADDVWQAQLEAAFGRGAVDARYEARGRGEEGSSLRAAYLARDAARRDVEALAAEVL